MSSCSRIHAGKIRLFAEGEERGIWRREVVDESPAEGWVRRAFAEGERIKDERRMRDFSSRVARAEDGPSQSHPLRHYFRFVFASTDLTTPRTNFAPWPCVTSA